MKKQSLIKGSIILGIAGITARFLGLFFRWPLIMLIGDEGVGYYQMSYPLYMFFIAIASGIPVAISKIISENNVLGDKESNFVVVKESTILMAIIGTGTSFVLFFFAPKIISILRWDEKAYYSLIGISLAPVIISFITVFRGFFQGYQTMTPSAVSQILEQIGRVVFGVGLAIILLPKGIEYSAGGAAFGAAGGGILALIYLYFKFIKTKKQLNVTKVKTDSKVLGNILTIAIPISLGASVSTIMSLIDSIFVPRRLLEAGLTSKEATILYAQLTGKASVIVNIPLTISMAICTSLVPIIAEVYVLKRKIELENKINLIIKLAAVISIPCLFGLFFMAGPIMKFIFPTKFQGIEILKYLSLSIPFIIVTQISTAILQGIGSYLLPVFNLLVGCITKIILTNMLVPNPKYNIYGAVIATVVSYVIVSILNLSMLKFKVKVKISLYKNFIKAAYASAFMMIVVLLLFNYVYSKTLSNSIACLLSIGIGAIIYFIGIIILRLFTKEEVLSKFKSKI